jgi:hypothetical protein
LKVIKSVIKMALSLAFLFQRDFVFITLENKKKHHTIHLAKLAILASNGGVDNDCQFN